MTIMRAERMGGDIGQKADLDFVEDVFQRYCPGIPLRFFESSSYPSVAVCVLLDGYPKNGLEVLLWKETLVDQESSLFAIVEGSGASRLIPLERVWRWPDQHVWAAAALGEAMVDLVAAGYAAFSSHRQLPSWSTALSEHILTSDGVPAWLRSWAMLKLGQEA